MKRIVICADGTWNEPERLDEKTGRFQPTNVLKTARAILPRSKTGVEQVVYYHEGVGTLGGVDKFTGGAFGSGMEKNIRELYRFLVYNYDPEDEVFLFGFSRGAFTARTLAGFINRVGLLEKDDEYYTPELYALYESAVSTDSEKWVHAFRNIKGIRKNPPIKFIGVWDTVGALGLPGLIGHFFNQNKYEYHDLGLNPSIQNAYHAVAIDEKRKPFKPSLWSKPDGWTGVLEQVWFAGVHSNVGGSYSPDGLANIALHWMVGNAAALGLEFDGEYLRHYEPHFDSTLNDSMTTIYRLMGPYEREVGVAPAGFETIHSSVRERQNDGRLNYRPTNLPE